MSQQNPRRLGRAKKAAALVPLAALSAAWTVNVLAAGEGTASASSDTSSSASSPAVRLPGGETLPPATVLKDPATVGTPATDLSPSRSESIVASADASGIPAAALAAYQRAATVMDQAAPSCHLDWQLLGAIGRIESDHGRADGNTLTDTGISRPGIFGPVLNGRNGVSLVRDTDGGALDGSSTYDRAVGPMQFLPSTWQNVAVDADGDGKRDPQDINDAALAAGVYLCSGGADLGTVAGQKQAVYRYNHSDSYVTTVLGVARAYRAGDYTAVPNSTMTSDYVFAPLVPTPTKASKPAHHTASQQASSGGSGPATTTSSTAPSTPSTPAAPKPTPTPSNPAAPITKVTKPVEQAAASTAQLVQVCTTALAAKGVKDPASAVPKALQECVQQLTGDTLPEAQKDVTGVVAGLAGLIQSLLGGVTSGVGGLLGGGGQ
jgi:hypothetical protein